MELYYFIFFATLIYLLFSFTRKIIHFINITSKMNKIKFEKSQKDKKEDEFKPEKFNSVLKERKSRLDKIIACKNS